LQKVGLNGLKHVFGGKIFFDELKIRRDTNILKSLSVGDEI
jgi:hypothetical protein